MLGFPSKKSLGQHFLFDTKVRDAIVKAAQLKSDDLVLEVGPGKGFLTKELIKNCGEVIAIEIDVRLVKVLQQLHTTSRNLKIVSGDVRDMDLHLEYSLYVFSHHLTLIKMKNKCSSSKRV